MDSTDKEISYIAQLINFMEPNPVLQYNLHIFIIDIPKSTELCSRPVI